MPPLSSSNSIRPLMQRETATAGGYEGVPTQLSPPRTDGWGDSQSNMTKHWAEEAQIIKRVISSHYVTFTSWPHIYHPHSICLIIISLVRKQWGEVTLTTHTHIDTHKHRHTQGRSEETNSGRKCVLAFLKGQLHQVIDTQTDLIVISLKTTMTEEAGD